jgi:transcriptional regulator with XRE-family HTH domain
MTSLKLKIDPREAQYGRFASNVLRLLNEAVSFRIAQGLNQSSISQRLDWKKGQLSRILSGRVSNITIKTLSDILWACDFEPDEIRADPAESLSPNQSAVDDQEFLWTTASKPAASTVTAFPALRPVLGSLRRRETTVYLEHQ